MNNSGSGANTRVQISLRTAGVDRATLQGDVNGAFILNTGSSTEVFRTTSGANFGVGTGATVSARIHGISTTEQLRLGYDASNYFSTTVASTGSTTFALTGTTPTFTFSNSITMADATNFTFNTSTGTKIGTATTEKLAFYNSTPIVQPANTVAIDDVLINLGLRASGGSANFNLKITNSLPQNLKGYTVATLPAGVVGDIAYVTDATVVTAKGAAPVGGGAAKAVVFHNSIS